MEDIYEGLSSKSTIPKEAIVKYIDSFKIYFGPLYVVKYRGRYYLENPKYFKEVENDK